MPVGHKLKKLDLEALQEVVETSKVTLNLEKIQHKHNLTMGKPKKALESMLDYNEMQTLKKLKQEKLKEIED